MDAKLTLSFNQKKHSSIVVKQKIDLLCQHMKIAENSFKGVSATLSNKKKHDFEDGLEFFAAKQGVVNASLPKILQTFIPRILRF